MRPKNLVNTSELLKDTKVKDYAIGGIETWDQTSLKAAIEVAAETCSPMQVLIGAVQVRSIGIRAFVQLACQYISETSVPIALHLDETTDVDVIMQCMENGFTSVMFDGAELDFDTNVRITKEITTVAYASNISVEASLGKMPYSPQGVIGQIEACEATNYLTNVEEAAEFVSKTGIDILAPSIGNIHALYRDTMPLPDVDLARRLHEATKLPLSLHGSTGATDEQIRLLIPAGFRKINIGTRFMELYRAAMRTAIDKYEGYPCAFKILEECKSAMKKEITRLVTEVYRSSGKAREIII